MAILNLQSPQWKYDEEARELIGTFLEAAPDDMEDPWSFAPERRFIARIPIPDGVQIINL